MRVGPVVEDVAEQVHVRAGHGLREEEVVRHEGDSGREGRGDGVGGAADHVREVLDDEGEVGVRLGEGDADVAAGTADVDDGADFAGGRGHGGGGIVSIPVGDMAVDGMSVGGVAVGKMTVDGMAVSSMSIVGRATDVRPWIILI